ncbi:F-box/FBD/LRR-repeat protein [Heracleum sosnowskyi]|uniref:F-box/FBD/LRR-repeat protein n=1 Tax=Heracleum sosnowskyi TaxID=360622 RepID=A0AAD8N4K5_9APIA|nr:F-box/FBD/LRR-repeat protein [Heracleum sosnowskyi]
MKRRDPPKVPCKMEMDIDYISNLPEHITDKILSSLSLRDAVRTSILSKKWRYKWISLPHLIFDNQSLLISSQDQTLIRNKLINIVDHVLLLHSGPIQKFKLSHRDLQGVYDIDRWILFLSRGSVKEFILEIWKGHRYKLPASLYFCQKLIHLEIFNCLLKPPPTFNGFKNLKSLDLQHITMDQDVFDNLISSCTLIERLTLMNFDGFSQLNIHAPYLLFFDIGGVFDDVNFETTNNLAIVSIGLYASAGYEQNLPLGTTGNMIKFFAPLPRIQRLEVQSFFLKYLAAGKVPERLPTPCIELNYLSLRINFCDRAESLAALCILRSSPNLQELEILARPDEQAAEGTDAHISEEYFHNCPFNQLQLVKIVGISYAKQELNFVNFLLTNSPVLEKMTIKPVSANGGCELLKELLRFRRASVLAEIIYLDP